MRITDVRYKEDDPVLWDGTDLEDESFVAHSKRIRRSLYANSVLVTPELFPELYKTIIETKTVAARNLQFDVFVRSDPTPQAFFINLAKGEDLAVIVTSSLVELLSQSELQFVLGHELAHFLFDHYRYPRPEDAENELEFLHRVYLSRSAEISADRVGFLCCPSVDDAIKGMIKVASGLSSKHIKLDASSYIQQLRKIKSLQDFGDSSYSTHPIFPLRVRALLWFSMSEPFYQLTGNKGKSPLSHEKLDENVAKDMHEISDHSFIQKETDALALVFLWSALKLALFDRKITRDEQVVLKKYIPDKLVDKSIAFLKGQSGDLNAVVDQKLNRGLDSLTGVREKSLLGIRDKLSAIASELGISEDYVAQTMAALARE